MNVTHSPYTHSNGEQPMTTNQPTPTTDDTDSGIPSLISSHAKVLLTIHDDPFQTMRVMADRIGITERRCAQIIRDLKDVGYISIERAGRRSRYTINHDKPINVFPSSLITTVGQFVAAFMLPF